MDQIHDPDRIADLLLPLGAPYESDAVVQTAMTLAELVRRLNHATFGGSALRYPAHLYQVLGGIRSAAYGLDQTLRQLSTQLDRWTTDPRIGHDRGGGPSRTCAVACEHLRQCADALHDVTAPLDAAHELTSHLSLDESRPVPPRSYASETAPSPITVGNVGDSRQIEDLPATARPPPVSPAAVAKTFDTPGGPDDRHSRAAAPPAQRFPARSTSPDTDAEQHQHRQRPSR